jgi:hypothetical protein
MADLNIVQLHTTLHKEQLLNLLAHPPNDLGIANYITYTTSIVNNLENRFKVQVNDEYLYGLLMNYLPSNIRQHFIRKGITQYQVARIIAPMLDSFINFMLAEMN